MLNATADFNSAAAPVPVQEAAFLFADIAGFTALTELEGDARAAELAWRMWPGA
jgi:class 3 adenylate cyclase